MPTKTSDEQRVKGEAPWMRDLTYKKINALIKERDDARTKNERLEAEAERLREFRTQVCVEVAELNLSLKVWEATEPTVGPGLLDILRRVRALKIEYEEMHRALDGKK